MWGGGGRVRWVGVGVVGWVVVGWVVLIKFKFSKMVGWVVVGVGGVWWWGGWGWVGLVGMGLGWWGGWCWGAECWRGRGWCGEIIFLIKFKFSKMVGWVVVGWGWGGRMVWVG